MRSAFRDFVGRPLFLFRSQGTPLASAGIVTSGRDFFQYRLHKNWEDNENYLSSTSNRSVGNDDPLSLGDTSPEWFFSRINEAGNKTTGIDYNFHETNVFARTYHRTSQQLQKWCSCSPF